MPGDRRNRLRRAQAFIMQNSLLIVEDDADLRTLYKMFLKSQGYTVHTASSGEEGWQVLEQHDVDVILLDLTLPSMSGAEFMQKLRGDEKHSHRKVIVSSGWDDLKAKAQELQADDYALKPTQMDVMKKKIDTLAASLVK